jgi:hypothetical protein
MVQSRWLQAANCYLMARDHRRVQLRRRAIARRSSVLHLRIGRDIRLPVHSNTCCRGVRRRYIRDRQRFRVSPRCACQARTAGAAKHSTYSEQHQYVCYVCYELTARNPQCVAETPHDSPRSPRISCISVAAVRRVPTGKQACFPSYEARRDLPMRLLASRPISEQGGDCPTMNQGTRFCKESTGFLPTGQASVTSDVRRYPRRRAPHPPERRRKSRRRPSGYGSPARRPVAGLNHSTFSARVVAFNRRSIKTRTPRNICDCILVARMELQL